MGTAKRKVADFLGLFISGARVAPSLGKAPLQVGTRPPQRIELLKGGMPRVLIHEST